MKTTLSALLAAHIALFALACGSSDDAADPTPEDAGGDGDGDSEIDWDGGDVDEADAGDDGDEDGGTDDVVDVSDLPAIAAMPNDPGCPPAGEGTTHASDVTGTERWTAAQSPHRVTSTITIKGTLLVEACATVELAEGVSIFVGTSSNAGRLITRGTYTGRPAVFKPVRFTGAGDAFWGMIFVSERGQAQFDNTILKHGGDAGAVSTSHGGALVVRGPNDGTLRRMVRAHSLFIVDSGSFGVTLESGGGFFADSASRLLITRTGLLPTPAGYGASFEPKYPVFVEPPGIGTLPEGIYVSGRRPVATNDVILVVPRNAIAVDEQFHNFSRGYVIQTPFYMRPTSTAKLTIDPGARLLFHREPESDARVGMTLGDSSGTDQRTVTIDIQGTARLPVVFTSDAASPAPGDWMGLYLDASPPSGNVIAHARFEYAGGESGTNSFGCGPRDNDAAILITNWRPQDAFIHDVEIKDSAGGGIVCGWASNADGPDLKAGNTFSGIGNSCDVSRPQKASGLACPDSTAGEPLCL